MTTRKRNLIVVILILLLGSVALLRPEMTFAQQLDDNCVVSILNRTIQVDKDGSWSMPNVPSTMGQIRARATCVRNGATTSGQTDYFNITNNGITEVGEIKFGSLDPIPTALVITVPNPTLTSAGATTQLSVTSQYSDGSSNDVTASSSGVNYSSSNPAVATVSANGLVTAVASGSIIVVARKCNSMGRAAVIRTAIRSATSGAKPAARWSRWIPIQAPRQALPRRPG